MEHPQQTCPACAFTQAAHFNYCGQCATPLKQVCGQCQQSVPADFRFCGYCAHPLKDSLSEPAGALKTTRKIAAAPPVEAHKPSPSSDPAVSPTYLEKPTLTHGAVARMQERRQVVILFCDLCGFTKLSEQLDPEEVSNIIHPLFETLSHIIHSYQGSIEKFIGDAIMAIFGVPVAHEDDPERALMVALAMQKAIREYSEKIQHDISMRIGLNVGTVVSGQVLYGGDKPDYTVIGDAVNTAARVEQHTPKGSILVTESLYSLTRDRFMYRTHSPIVAKGKAEPIDTYELLGVHKLRQASRGDLEVPVVGREKEQVLLRQWGEKLQDRKPVAVGISGEAGIGKSRLFYDLQVQLEQQLPLRTYRAYAVSYTQHASLSLLRQVLRQLLHVNESDAVEQVALVLKGHLRLLAGFDELQQALLLQLLYPDREDPVLQHQSADILQKQWYKVLSDFALKMAQAQPLFLILEDLQWADQASLDWLHYFLAQLPATENTHLLLGATWRSEALSSDAFAWHQTLHLPPLSPAACQRLFLHHLQLDTLPAALMPLAQRLVDRSRGNPYYLEESLRILKSTGALVQAADTWTLQGDLEDLPLPNSLQRLLLSQLDRLPEHLREVLQVAAVVGQSVEQKLLEGLQLWPIPALHDAIQACLAQGYWQHSAPGVYRFSNALMRETVYQTLLRKRRRQLHQHIGDYIEASDQWQSDTFDRLAHHFIRAQDTLKAMRYLYIAAQQSDRYFAHQAALSTYRKALDLLKGEAQGPDTLIAINPAGNEWVSLVQLQERIHLAIVDIYWLTADYTRALEEIAQALLFSSERFYQVRLYLKQGRCFEKTSRWSEALTAYDQGESLLENSYYVAEMAQLKNARAWIYYRQGEYTQAEASCEASLSILNSVPNMQELAYAHNIKGVIAYHKGEWEPARLAYERSLQIQEKTHDRWGQGNSWSNLGSVYLMTARLGEAEQAFLKSLELREALGDLNGVATSCNNLGHIYQEMKQPQQAVTYLSRSLEIYTQTGNALGRTISLCNLGMADYVCGHFEAAEKSLRQGIDGLRELEVTQVLPEALNGLAEVLLAQEQVADAATVLEEVAALLSQDPLQTTRYYRLRGWCAVQQEDFVSAQKIWQQALGHLKPEDVQEKTRLYTLLATWGDAVNLQSSTYWQQQLATLQPELAS